MATFGGTEEHWCEEVIGAQSWAYYVWSVENRANFFGASVERSSKGYVGAEIERLKNDKKRSRDSS